MSGMVSSLYDKTVAGSLSDMCVVVHDLADLCEPAVVLWRIATSVARHHLVSRPRRARQPTACHVQALTLLVHDHHRTIFLWLSFVA